MFDMFKKEVIAGNSSFSAVVLILTTSLINKWEEGKVIENHTNEKL